MATARLVRDAFELRLAPLELGLNQAVVLMYLSDFGPVTQTRIADHLLQGRAATGVIVDRLQDRALVDRQPDPDDRRVWLVDLTASARHLVGEIRHVDEQLRTELRSGISRAERQALASVLERLRANLSDVIASSPDGTRPTTIRSAK
jgi:DNA-binding MarR family transcriptional regulator